MNDVIPGMIRDPDIRSVPDPHPPSAVPPLPGERVGVRGRLKQHLWILGLRCASSGMNMVFNVLPSVQLKFQVFCPQSNLQ
ncbi:MAG: hypothetical protein MAG581_02399 [Deltaproteobacteria bacterium]|nr:hypothetical protein [Deltaproteobacteria bacterium]